MWTWLESVNLARRLVANDLVRDTDEAFNLMVATAQEFQISFEDIFDVASEFAPVFSKLGVDGATAFRIIGETVQQGLLPNVDRAAELFEEFNIRVTDNSARDAIDDIGLSMDKVRAATANGLGDQAISDVAQALLDVEDAALRDEKAIEIFGASIESASDPEAVLRLLATADAMGEVGNAADVAAAQVEANQTVWDQAGREATDFGHKIGRIGGAALDAAGDFQQLVNISEQYDPEADLDAAAAAAERMSDKMDDGFHRAADAIVETIRSSADFTAETETMAVGISDAEKKVNRLESAMRSLSDWADSSGEAALRSVHEGADRIVASFEDLEAASYGVAEGWDLTTEAGRLGSETTERLRQDVARLTEEYIDGKVGPEEFSAAMADLEHHVRVAGERMGLTAAEVDALVESVVGVPRGVEIQVDAKTAAANQRISDLNAQLDGSRRQDRQQLREQHHQLVSGCRVGVDACASDVGPEGAWWGGGCGPIPVVSVTG